jgi:hypothetical protein
LQTRPVLKLLTCPLFFFFAEYIFYGAPEVESLGLPFSAFAGANPASIRCMNASVLEKRGMKLSSFALISQFITSYTIQLSRAFVYPRDLFYYWAGTMRLA